MHNTKALDTGRGLENFPAIVTRLAGMAGRFATMPDCVDTGFIPRGLLDEPPLSSQTGAVRIGGIDVSKPRSRTALAAPADTSFHPAPPGSSAPCSPSGNKLSHLCWPATADPRIRRPPPLD